MNKDGTVRMHHGVDILASKGTSLKSILAGEVISVNKNFKPGEYAENSYGNFIVIKSVVDGENVFIKYAHLDEVKVEVGTMIEMGFEIGLTGNTGNAEKLRDSEDHVHIEASKGGNAFSLKKRINPEKFFETKFDSEGNPMNPNSFTDTEINEIQEFLNTFQNKNSNGTPASNNVSLPSSSSDL